MMRSFVVRNKVVLLHISFWVLYASYRVYDISEYLGLRKAMIYLSVPTSFNIIASYIHYFFILPPLIRDKKALPYAGRLLVLLFVIFSLRILVENEILAQITTNESYYKTLRIPRIISTVWDTMSFLIFTGMIRFTFDWFDLENKKRQLENEKLVAELNYLKAQINPHFLFNTLHNLNYLVYAGSKSATEVIIKLSNIMRYMIYDANKEKVSLQKEIAYMNDYVDLESIRLNRKFQIDFHTDGNTRNVEIAPLIMITFLENAFKHGVSDQEANCWIKVDLVVTDTVVKYSVSNRKLKSLANAKLKSGFGLDNVMKRLHLSYPGQHQLDIIDNKEVYQVFLTLNIA